MALKKALKAHKLFVAELERCRRLEREGEQVLSSLANVSDRLPLLLADSPSSSSSISAPASVAADGGTGDGGIMGVLSACADAQTLLLRKHFGALEKSMAFLRDIVREFADVLRRLKTFVTEHAELQDELVASDDGGGHSALFLAQQGEWMENVLAMYERELRRKRLLVADIEYHDASHIARRHAHWSARGAQSSVDYRYVQGGLEPPPLIPKPSRESPVGSGSTSSSSSGADSRSHAKKKKKRR